MESQVQNVNIDLIIPNRFQPRLAFDEKALNDLAESIKQHGIIQPLVVRQLAGRYEIIAGERRYKAAIIAGLQSVPVIVTSLSDAKSEEVALVENIQRKNLSSIEEARSYKRMLDKDNLTQEQLAKKLGLSQSTIANRLRLLNLSDNVQNALLKEKISERHARSLLQINDKLQQDEILNKIITERLTVRQLDELIKNRLDSNVTEPEMPVKQDIVPNEVAKSEPELLPIESLDTTLNSQSESLENVSDLDVNSTASSKDLNGEDKSATDEEPMNNILSFLQSFNNSTPSLDDEPANLQTFDDDIFNEAHNVDDSVEEAKDSSEVLDLDNIKNSSVSDENQVKPDNSPIIISGDINSLKKAYHDLQDEAEKAGFKISMEDFDFEDLYQMIIKIDK